MNDQAVAERRTLPVQQSPRDLRLCVFSGAPQGDFRVLHRVSIAEGAWGAEFAIIGESHQITLYHQGAPFLSEVLACVETPRSLCQHLHAFDDLQPHSHIDQALGYHVAIHFSDTPPRTASPYHLQFAFPEIWGRIPVTQIGWQIERAALSWWTLHTYPRVDGVCFVTSRSSHVFHAGAYQERGR